MEFTDVILATVLKSSSYPVQANAITAMLRSHTPALIISLLILKTACEKK
jgi:hypothetical protein